MSWIDMVYCQFSNAKAKRCAPFYPSTLGANIKYWGEGHMTSRGQLSFEKWRKAKLGSNTEMGALEKKQEGGKGSDSEMGVSFYAIPWTQASLTLPI